MNKPLTTKYRRGLIATVKIAQKDLGMDEVTYRDMLANLTGRDSCRDLTDRQIVLVIAHLRERGWTPVAPSNTAPRPKVKPELEPLRSKIGALLIDSGKSWAYADSILKRMFGIPGVSWADRDQLVACVSALTRQARSQARRAAQAVEQVEA